MMNLPLLRLDNVTKSVVCCLCDNIHFKYQNGGEELVRHLVKFHRVKNPSRTLFNLFDGSEFSYKTMAKDYGELVKEIPKTPTNRYYVQRVSIRGGNEQPDDSVGSEEREAQLEEVVSSLNLGPAPLQRKTDSVNKCIVCQKSFSSSEEVQRHLLTDHVGGNTTSKEQSRPEAVTCHVDPLSIKQDDFDADVKVVIELEDDDEADTKDDITLTEDSGSVIIDEDQGARVAENNRSADIEVINDDIVSIESSTDNDTEVEVDDEHFTINNVQVNIEEADNGVGCGDDAITVAEIVPGSVTDEIVIKNELQYEENFASSNFLEKIVNEVSEASLEPNTHPQPSASEKSDTTENSASTEIFEKEHDPSEKDGNLNIDQVTESNTLSEVEVVNGTNDKVNSSSSKAHNIKSLKSSPEVENVQMPTSVESVTIMDDSVTSKIVPVSNVVSVPSIEDLVPLTIDSAPTSNTVDDTDVMNNTVSVPKEVNVVTTEVDTTPLKVDSTPTKFVSNNTKVDTVPSMVGSVTETVDPDSVDRVSVADPHVTRIFDPTPTPDDTISEDHTLQLDLPSTSLSPGKDSSPKSVNLKCQLCEQQLTSMLNFSLHMRKFHKDSEQEKNKPFNCDKCKQGFYFLSSLNSHKSKAHHETSGD